jgi:hypothetical protein
VCNKRLIEQLFQTESHVKCRLPLESQHIAPLYYDDTRPNLVMIY